MIYPIVTVICLLLRGQLSLHRNQLNLSDQSNNAINSLLKSCAAEELSKLLNQPKESAPPHWKTSSKEQMVNNLLTHRTDITSNSEVETLSRSSEDSIENTIPDNYIAVPHISQKLLEENKHEENRLTMNLPEKISENEMTPPLRESNHWPLNPSLYPYPLMIGHRKPLTDVKVKIGFKNKEREVNVTVSPLMTIVEVLKQAEIKFERMYKLPLENSLISFWMSPTLRCVIIDKISTIRSDQSMIWTISVIDRNGELQYEDYCLPTDGELFVTPGSTVLLSYKSLSNSEDLY